MRGTVGEGKTEPSWLDDTPPVNLDYPDCTVYGSLCVSEGECVSLFPIDYTTFSPMNWCVWAGGIGVCACG